MTQRFRRLLSASFLVVALLFASQPSFACGPFSLEAVFTFVVHPEFPLEKFAGGEIGVLQPTYARSYLFAAYRNFIGIGFSSREQKDLLDLWKERLDYTWPDFDEAWPKPWLDARQSVASASPAPRISVYRHREKPNEYETYINCQKDAFEMAATTLSDRIKKFTADSPVIKDWVAAQDLVFANCSEGQHMPAATSADADPLVRADRAYQIAAADFYSGNFDEAIAAFDAIAQDTRSPWRSTASYLSARALVRKASLSPADKKQEALAHAEDVLQRVLSDRSQSVAYPAANRLLNVVRLRVHPEAKLHGLAETLPRKNNETLKQDLWDYTVLMDQFAGEDDSDQNKAFPVALRKDDLTDWIVTLQSAGEAPLDHSLQRWRETSSMPWLVAALTKIHSGHPQAAALLAAAEKVDSGSPAFATASFHQVRLALESGRFDQARAKLDEILAKKKASLPASSVNLFLTMRTRLARSLAEFLTFAQRRPAGFSWNEDDRELPADISEDSDLNKSLAGQSFFDLDGARVLNEGLPLSLLQQAAESKSLPEHLRRDVAQAAWLRAVLLDDRDRAMELAPTLKSLVPEIVPFLDDYLSSQPEEARKFSAIYTWLKFPGLQPIVNSGVGRRLPLDKQDVYRENWWCAAALSPESATSNQGEADKNKSEPAVTIDAAKGIPFPAFLSETQKTAARSERARLSSLGAAPNYLCRQVIEWTQGHPTDPRAPEALYLAVRTTRYGCTNKETGKWSKAAYDFLHKRYPTSTWAKKTPYWFKD